MMQLTKIFHFETAHAIHNYPGSCKNIHGHSYRLEVTVVSTLAGDNYIPAPGFIIDFKEIKKLVTAAVIDQFDHKLLLSSDYLSVNSSLGEHENLVVWTVEPTAENMLIYIRKELEKILPPVTRLVRLKLYETEDSFAEWMINEYPGCY